MIIQLSLATAAFSQAALQRPSTLQKSGLGRP